MNMAPNSNSMFAPCLVLAVMVISAGNVGANSYSTYSLQDPCSAGREYYLGTLSSGALVKSQSGAVYRDSQQCTITIRAIDNYKIFLTSETISVEDGLDCIILYDGPDTFGSEALRHCSSSDLQFTTSQKYLTISFDTDGSVNYSGFTLVVTPVRPNDSGFNCAYDSNYFSCVTSGNCIDIGFDSDGHQNCPDSSDEPVDCTANLYYDMESCQNGRGCYSTYEHCDGNTDCSDGSDETNCDPSVYTNWSSGQLAGLFIGYIIFAAIVIAIVVVVHKNCKKRSG